MGEGYLVPDLAPGEIHRVEDVIRRSRFIATFARVSSTEEAKDFLERIPSTRRRRTTAGPMSPANPGRPRRWAQATTESPKERPDAPC